MSLVRPYTVDPYITTYGKLIKVDAIKDRLAKYLVSASVRNLNYEIANVDHDITMAFITGCNDEEKSLPSWSHPLIINLPRGTVVVSDVRKYVSNITDQPLSLREITKDRGAMEFIILRTLLTADLLAGNYGKINSISKNISLGFGLIMSDIVNNYMMLNPVEKVRVEIAAAYYMSVLTINSTDVDIEERILDRLRNMKLSVKLPDRDIKEIVKNFDMTADNGVQSLISNIKSVLTDDKHRLLTVDTIMLPFNNMWYGPGENSTLQISVENVPTWISVMYVLYTDNTYKKSRLATMLQKYKTRVDDDKLVKDIADYLKDNYLK
jgi:hypothetical protein